MLNFLDKHRWSGQMASLEGKKWSDSLREDGLRGRQEQSEPEQ